MEQKNMSFLHFGFNIVIFCSICSFVECNTQWIQAYETCKNKGMKLTPINSINLPSGIYSSTITMWTPNYALDPGCFGNTGLYVEQLPKTISYKGLCVDNATKIIQLSSNTYSNLNCTCWLDHSGGKCPNALMNITSRRLLSDAMESMEWNTKYWISDMNLDLNRFHKQCEIYSQRANTSTASKSRISMTYCDRIHQYVCVDEGEYRTAISLIRLPNEHDRPHETVKQEDHSPQTDTSLFLYISMATTGAVLICIIFLECLIRHRIMEVKLEVHKLQKKIILSQPMYMNSIEPLHIDEERFPESETQMTSYDASSLYESIASSHGMNVTVSYLTSRQVQHIVAMTDAPEQSTSTQRNDRLTAQEQITPRLITRANCVRKKSMINNQNNNSENRQYARQTSTVPSSARLYDFSDNMFVGENQWYQNDHGLDSCDVAEETRHVVKNKPSPKPRTKSQTLLTKKINETRKSHKIPFSENWNGSGCFLNNEHETGELENPENDDKDEEYETIWKITH